MDGPLFSFRAQPILVALLGAEAPCIFEAAGSRRLAIGIDIAELVPSGMPPSHITGS